MKIGDLLKSVISEGISHDPRGISGVKAFIEKVQKEYNVLSESDKRLFDRQKLTNPFSDTRLLYGDLSKEIKNIMIGIDIDASEILLAKSLLKDGKSVDIVISHHPEGFARSIFYEVMNVQLDILVRLGVSKTKAKKLLDERMNEVMRKVLSGNVMRQVDAARLLEIPFMCVHTPADNFVAEYLTKVFAEKKPKKLCEIIDILLKEPEYEYGVSVNTPPKIILGEARNSCGKIFVDMTGGTEGSKKIFPELVKARVKTIIGMHMSEEHFKKAKKHSINVIIAGHIPSDNLGLNLLLDAIDKKKELNVIECSGFRRFRRE